MAKKPIAVKELEFRHGGESYITPDRTIYYSAKRCGFMPTRKVKKVLPGGALVMK